MSRSSHVSGGEQPRVRCQIDLPQRGLDGVKPTKLVTFDGLADDREHIALMWGSIGDPPLVRIHSECLTGDVLDSARCDCGEQLAETMRRFSVSGGILLYLRQEGRGIGLYNKIDAYVLQDAGADTVEANIRLGFPPDSRRYDVAAQMLKALGFDEVVLVTNNPEKVSGLEAAGVRVSRRVATGFFVSASNRRYLETKKARMGHLLPDEDTADAEADPSLSSGAAQPSR